MPRQLLLLGLCCAAGSVVVAATLQLDVGFARQWVFGTLGRAATVGQACAWLC